MTKNNKKIIRQKKKKKNRVKVEGCIQSDYVLGWHSNAINQHPLLTRTKRRTFLNKIVSMTTCLKKSNRENGNSGQSWINAESDR